MLVCGNGNGLVGKERNVPDYGVFSSAEYQRRLAALQHQMQRMDVDALLLATPADIFYITGFLTRFWESPARPWFVIVPVANDPMAVIPSIGLDLMRETWITDIRTWESPNPDDEGVSLLSASLCEVVPTQGTIGLPMGEETHLRMPLIDYAALLGRIKPRAVKDATAIIRNVRMVKSEAEVSKIRYVSSIADAAFARVPEFAGPGVRLDEVYRDFQIALLQEGADWISYLAGASASGGYAGVIAPANARALQPGDVLMLDTGAVCGGYFCDFNRNFAIAKASTAVRRAYDCLYGATQRALENVRPGLTAAELHALIYQDLVGQGAVPCAGRFGHGLGVSLTEWPSISPTDHTILCEGMVLAIEPSVQIAPGQSMVHEENIVIRGNHAELLSTRATARLPVLVV